MQTWRPTWRPGPRPDSLGQCPRKPRLACWNPTRHLRSHGLGRIRGKGAAPGGIMDTRQLCPSGHVVARRQPAAGGLVRHVLLPGRSQACLAGRHAIPRYGRGSAPVYWIHVLLRESMVATGRRLSQLPVSSQTRRRTPGRMTGSMYRTALFTFDQPISSDTEQAVVQAAQTAERPETVRAVLTASERDIQSELDFIELSICGNTA